MNLKDIQGSYDVVTGLGCWCGPALHLKRHNLRRNSFPLDWVQSPYLSDVNRLMKNKFEGYMELKNMIKKDINADFIHEGNVVFQAGGTEPAKAHFIHDTYYNIDSVHDFPIIPNQDWTVQYASFKEKLNHRIQNFLSKLAQSQYTLFIRHEVRTANYKEIVELQSILSKMTKGKFNILIMERVDGLQGVKDMNSDIEGICLVQVPRSNPGNNAIWDQILQGITLTH